MPPGPGATRLARCTIIRLLLGADSSRNGARAQAFCETHLATSHYAGVQHAVSSN